MTAKKPARARKPKASGKRTIDIDDIKEQITEIYLQACEGNDDASAGLCSILDQVALSVVMLRDARVEDHCIAHQVAVSASTLTRELCQILATHPEYLQRASARCHEWPVLVNSKGLLDEGTEVNVRRLKIGHEYPFRAVNLREDYYRVLADLYLGWVENFETGRYQRLPLSPPVDEWCISNGDKAVNSLTDYAIQAFDFLMGGRKWEESVFLKRFPIRSWVAEHKPDSIGVYHNLRNTYRNKIRAKVERLYFSASSKKGKASQSKRRS